MRASVARVPIEGTFELEDGPVTATIVVGERQQGYSIVSVDDDEKCEGEEVDECPLGEGEDLVGSSLYTDTTVTVTNPSSLRTIVTIVVRQGTRSSAFPGTHTASAVGDTVVFEGDIALIRGDGT